MQQDSDFLFPLNIEHIFVNNDKNIKKEIPIATLNDKPDEPKYTYYILNKPFFLVRYDRENDKYTRDVENVQNLYEYEYDKDSFSFGNMNLGQFVPKTFYNKKTLFSYLQLEKNYLKDKQTSGYFEGKNTRRDSSYRAKWNVLYMCEDCVWGLPTIIEKNNRTGENKEYSIQELRKIYNKEIVEKNKRKNEEKLSKLKFKFASYFYNNTPYSKFVNRLFLEKLNPSKFKNISDGEIEKLKLPKEVFNLNDMNGILFNPDISYINCGTQKEIILYYRVSDSIDYHSRSSKPVPREDNCNILKNRFLFNIVPTILDSNNCTLEGIFESKKYKNHLLVRFSYVY
jgi:hypothetical protein